MRAVCTLQALCRLCAAHDGLQGACVRLAPCGIGTQSWSGAPSVCMARPLAVQWVSLLKAIAGVSSPAWWWL